jgi:hypothetical protein|tara:strand:+ start:18691 stop:19047 length:357 start_codon:yes stop_codon:yes gene_type:complete
MDVLENLKQEQSSYMDIMEDAYDVSLWLRQKYLARHFQLWVGCHNLRVRGQIARIELTESGTSDGMLTSAANSAFQALGYTIKDTGAAIHSFEPVRDASSSHDSLRAYARLEAALKNA